ncbi:MAG TPA: alpha/beta hydrolase [Candidatus Dormibacteraeota bacterium]|nr:alpha/beta hydrolase [Candidatus Dormibacteraeota bacterium]
MDTFPKATNIQLPARHGDPGITLSVHQQGAGFPVVLLHGFPDLAITWRHQFPALAQAGFRAMAPDQRGFGASDKPEKIADYDLIDLTGDTVGLLDTLGGEKAVFAGHDWGGVLAWAMAVLHPERTAGVIGVCTPYMALPGINIIRAAFGQDDAAHYIVWFQKPGVAEAVLDRQARVCFEKLMRRNIPPGDVKNRPDMNPFRRLPEMPLYGEPLVSGDVLAVYAETFARTGFRGGINWYRNIDRNLELVPDMGKKALKLPCLMLTAEWDFALPPRLAAGMPELRSDLEMHMIVKAGHWVHQEFPDEVNRLMIDWLRPRFL